MAIKNYLNYIYAKLDVLNESDGLVEEKIEDLAAQIYRMVGEVVVNRLDGYHPPKNTHHPLAAGDRILISSPFSCNMRFMGKTGVLMGYSSAHAPGSRGLPTWIVRFDEPYIDTNGNRVNMYNFKEDEIRHFDFGYIV